jgi:hypothetical protein
MCMGLGFDRGSDRACLLYGYTDLTCDRRSYHLFLAGRSKILLPVFRRSTAIGINDVYLLGVAVQIIIVMGWS